MQNPTEEHGTPIDERAELSFDGDLFRSVVSSIGIGLILTDATGTIRCANAEAETYFGVAADRIVGGALKDFCMLDEPDEIDQLIRMYRDAGVRRAFADDVEFNGNWYNVRFSLVEDQNGAFAGVLLCIQNIHTRKLMEQQMRTATIEMESANLELADTMDRIEAQAGRLNLAFEELRAADERIKDQNEKLLKDLNSARRIQTALLPQAIPEIDNWRFNYKYHPCEQVGGDVLNIFALDDRHVAIYQADVSGHGVSAAMVSVFAHQAIKSIVLGRGADRIVPPNEVLSRLNQDLIRAEFEDMPFLTIFYGILDTETHRLRFTAAAHPMPVLIDRTERSATSIQYPDASPLGWFLEDDYTVSELEMQPGQRLFIHTDGVTEIFDAENNMLTDEQFVEHLVQGSDREASEFGDDVVRMVCEFTGKDVQDDDITLITIDCLDGDRIRPGEGEETLSRPTSTIDDAEPPVETLQ